VTNEPGARETSEAATASAPKRATQIAALRIDRGRENFDTKPRRSRWWIVLGIVALGAGAGYHFLTQTRPVEVQIATAAAMDSKSANAPATVLNASGYVVARRKATVSSKVTGRVTEIFVEEGMTVEKGQLLARLDASVLEANFELSKAQLAATRSSLGETEAQLQDSTRQLERVQNLRAQGYASDAEDDTLSAQSTALRARINRQRQDVKVAQRQIDLRQQEISDMEIRAPFAGVAISKDAQPGEMVSPMSAGGGFTRTGICTIVDMTSLEIEVDVSESYINRVAADQSVLATLDAYPDWQIPGKVITIVPAADRQKATVKVRIAIDKLDPRILPDMGAKVAFQENRSPLGEPAAAAIGAENAGLAVVSIPESALRKDGERDAVFVLENGIARRKAVKAEKSANGSARILAGLRAGEQVITRAPTEVQDGMPVALEK
jgi:RND family efflux transporter MFP subunit